MCQDVFFVIEWHHLEIRSVRFHFSHGCPSSFQGPGIHRRLQFRKALQVVCLSIFPFYSRFRRDLSRVLIGTQTKRKLMGIGLFRRIIRYGPPVDPLRVRLFDTLIISAGGVICVGCITSLYTLYAYSTTLNPWRRMAECERSSQRARGDG